MNCVRRGGRRAFEEVPEQRHTSILERLIFGMLEGQIEKGHFQRMKRLVETALNRAKCDLERLRVEFERGGAAAKEIAGKLIENQDQGKR
jgi:hypothetical protein